MMMGSAAGLVGVALGGLATYGLVAPRSRIWAPVIWRGDPVDSEQVALTFDDGPTPESTPRILDILGELGVSCAFFVVGQRAERHPALIERMDAEGHLVCNHSYHHTTFGSVHGSAYWNAELQRTDDVIEAIIGRRPALFRPPMGLKTGHMARAARQQAHDIVTWSRRPFDGVPVPARKIVNRLVPKACGGDIILLHDKFGPGSGPNDIGVTGALRPLVRGLMQRHLTPVRLDQLIDVAPYKFAAGKARAAV